MKVHCLFEQSGTFKNEFKKLGYQAYDYDILNDFNQTDYIIDLFYEIEKSYDNEKSIFDNISKNDLIFAFFPCVRFTHRNLLNFVKTNYSPGCKISDIVKLEDNIKRFQEINYFYSLISKLVIVCLRKNLKLIIENPYHSRHILTQFWHLKPKIIDYDRTLRGDNFKKPTQYWFINFEPKHNFIFQPLTLVEYKKIENCNKVERSLINSNYAERFIKEFIL